MPFLSMPGGDSIHTPASWGYWYEYSGADLESVKGWDEVRSLMLVHLRETGEELADVLVGRWQWRMLALAVPRAMVDEFAYGVSTTTIMGVPIVKVDQANCLIFRHRRG